MILKISRLTGEGSKKLSLREHGPHVDSRGNLKDTVVRAKVEIESKKITLERSLNKPANLKIKPETERSLVYSYLEMAQLGQHVLSRREILRYVTAEAGKRAKEIQVLLNLEETENLRKVLVSIENDADSELKSSESNLNVAKSDINKLISLSEFSEEETLNMINDLRTILGASKILLTELTPKKIKESLRPLPFKVDKDSLTIEQIKNNIKEILTLIEERDELAKKEIELKTVLKEIFEEVKLRNYSLYKKLFELGIKLVDETNVCPLCRREWKEGDFKTFLTERVKEIEVTQEKQTIVNTNSSILKQKIDLLRSDVENLLKAQRQFGLDPIEEKETNMYLSDLKLWSEVMLNPTEIFENKEWPSVDIINIFDNAFLKNKLVPPLEDILKNVGQQLSERLEAWDKLTKMEDKWKKYKEELNNKEKAELFKTRAKALLKYFEEARYSVLESIYEAIEDKFNDYYKIIHSEDEENFSSRIEHKGSELTFEVDFYRRGLFPPQALHSEGHQDSMGVCLFFALNKYLTKDAIKLVILDDVVMSIDRNHRRRFCNLLKKRFPERQFIITTHDSAWAKQLKTEGVVELKNMIHFVYWNIETGPIFELEEDLWNKINKDLGKNDVPSAAHKLRYNAECFFEHVCDFLNAKVRYKGNHQWDLGDFAPAAISLYKEYLKKAKVNFQKMKIQDKFEETDDLDKKANEIIGKSQVEQWIINKNVHYNKWEHFSKEDFEPVVNAFKDLFSLFCCQKCGSIISVSHTLGTDPKSSVSCGCGKLFWNVD